MNRLDMVQKLLRLCEDGRDGWGRPITLETMEKWIRCMARGAATDDDVRVVVELASTRRGGGR